MVPATSTALAAMRLRLTTALAALTLFAVAHSCFAEALVKAQRDAMMRDIVDAWMVTQDADGFLPYGFDFLTGRRTDDPKSGGYMIRQAGALWGWARYYGYSGDARYREPIRRGLAALAQHSLPIGKSRAQAWLEQTRVLWLPAGRLTLKSALRSLGLLYDATGAGKVVSANGDYATAWSGTTALALLVELEYRRVTHDDRFAPFRTAWRDGLLALRIPGGGFRESPTSIDDSDFFNGEAWLALAVYADTERNDRVVIDMLADLDARLMRRYAEHPSSTFYQWGAMAAAQRWRTTGDPQFLDYLKQQAEVFTERFGRQIDEDDNACAPMEGLAVTQGAFVESGEGSSALAQRVVALLDREAAKLPSLQIQRGQTQMKLGGEAILTAPHLAEFAGSFLWTRKRPETRVDFAQHCLSALMMIEDNERAGRTTVQRVR